ncbi:MAG: NAD(P)/FAD-dependent oxidoreductase, partial [Bacteroidota bacterium]
EFLKQSTLVTGGILLATSLPGFSIGKKTRVIIIGGGFAGLSAAYYLQKKNIDFVVLESRNRIGGRVFSHNMDEKENLVVELGAEWVGASHERLIALTDEMGLKLDNNQFDTHLIYKGKYSKKNEWDYSDAWKNKFESLLQNYSQLTEDDKIKLDRMDWWRYLVNNGCDGRDLDIRELTDSTDFGETIRSVSAYAALAEYAESSPKNEMDFKIKGGNASLAMKLGEKIGKDKIYKGHTVERIVQGDKVTVYCSNGEQFEGDKLICTAPTFAVKKIKWEPELPLEMQLAMNELQYARINKNPVLFKDRFWKEENFDMVTDTPAHYFYHATKNQASKKGVLISYTIGDKAQVIANQSDNWKADMLQQSLSPYFGDVKSLIEKQTNYYWGEDEYSKGSYAVYGKGQWFGLQPVLKKPFLNTHFAGEHLADWQGFMEGAINTGEAAAEAVL